MVDRTSLGRADERERSSEFRRARKLVQANDRERTNEEPVVSVVVPAKDEASYLGETLASVAALDAMVPYEVLVVDGGSTDGTAEVASEYGATVVDGAGTTIAEGRNLGGALARGEWVAFVDADTTLRREYLTRMLEFAEREGLAAASSRCRITGPARARLMELTINHVFSRLRRPILPGFNFLIRREVFAATGGFPDVPNEDTAYSRRLARQYRTGYCPDVLVDSSGRRVAESGLTGTLVHYAKLDVGRIRAGGYPVTDSPGQRNE